MRGSIEETLAQVTQETKNERDKYRMFKRKVKAERHLHQQTRKVLAYESEKKKENTINEFKTRQQNIYEEKRAKLAADDLANEDRKRKELQEYRDFQETHWKRQVKRIDQVDRTPLFFFYP